MAPKSATEPHMGICDSPKGTPDGCPERVCFPPRPTLRLEPIGTLFVWNGRWDRTVVPAVPAGVPSVGGIHSFEAHLPALYPNGVVVLGVGVNPVKEWEPGILSAVRS